MQYVPENDCSNAEDIEMCEEELRMIKQYNKEIDDLSFLCKKYQEIVDSCEIPVIVIDRELFKRHYFDKILINKPKIKEGYLPTGYYTYLGGVLGWPKEFIFLHDSKNSHMIIAFYFHEEGHRLCHKKGCFCKSDETVSEYHANEYCIEKLLEFGFYDSLKLITQTLKSIAITGESMNPHQHAAELIMQGDLFKSIFQGGTLAATSTRDR